MVARVVIAPGHAMAYAKYAACVALVTSLSANLLDGIAKHVLAADPFHLAAEHKPLSRVDAGLRSQARSMDRPRFSSDLRVLAMDAPRLPVARLAIGLDQAEASRGGPLNSKLKKSAQCKSSRCGRNGSARVVGKSGSGKKRHDLDFVVFSQAKPYRLRDRYAETTAEITERGLRARG